MIDYNSVNTQLIYAGADVWASESHGFQCGIFCASNGLASALWQDYLLVGIEDKADFDESFAMLAELAQQASEEILSDELIFIPLLPDDQVTITERSNSVSKWCAGFASGLGIGGVDKKLNLTSEGDEFVRDVVAISRMETTVDEGEDAEVAYFEIVEYIRVGIIFIHRQIHKIQKTNTNREEIVH